MLKWFKGSISSRVQIVQGFNEVKGSIGSIGSRVQLVQEFNFFKGSICSRVQFVQGFNFFKGSVKCKPWQDISRPILRAVERNYMQNAQADLSFMGTQISVLGPENLIRWKKNP